MIWLLIAAALGYSAGQTAPPEQAKALMAHADLTPAALEHFAAAQHLMTVHGLWGAAYGFALMWIITGLRWKFDAEFSREERVAGMIVSVPVAFVAFLMAGFIMAGQP